MVHVIGPHVWFGPGWGFTLIPILGLLLLVAVIVLVVLLVVWATRPHERAPATAPIWHPGAGGSSALHILEERYARGEISREEFVERRAVLLGHSPPPTPPPPATPPPAP